MTGKDAMGIIFPNFHDASLPELVDHRTTASIPFGGRYRMIDFPLSGMTGAGIRNIGVIVRENYQSLMGHLGSGREWDLSSKRGGLTIFPPFGREGGVEYRGRIQGLASVMQYLQEKRESLVVMSDCNIACDLDYRALIEAHLESGADVTAVYERAPIKEGMQNDNYTFRLDAEHFVKEVRINDYRKGMQNVSMEFYVIGRELLIAIVKEAMVRGHYNFIADVLSKNLKKYKMFGYEYTGYRARIYDMRSYFEENLRLLETGNLDALFPEERPVYTKVRDEAPVRYAIDAKVFKSMLADGCIIEGEVEHSVLFRGVRVGKGAVIKDCVIMQGTQIGPGAVLQNVVTDKNVVVGPGQHLTGAANFPVFVGKNSTVGAPPAPAATAKKE
ncbi:glucose-1-phosphate adenylyltransferase subunit GlgD [Ruminococcaceae bacterium OttesenSCG-928-I18]|nr:glucose-1-phosphate adenylyltransferase subunit GlgD [Ruminococcaceae bacterium OttesenSCG-928-I18]